MIKTVKEEVARSKSSGSNRGEGGAQKEAASFARLSGVTQGKTACWQRRGLLVAVSLLAALIISPKLTSSVEVYRVGSIARKNVKAPLDFLVEDLPSTLKKKEEVAAASLDIYDFDDGATVAVREKVAKGFSLMRQLLMEIEGNARNPLGSSAGSDAGKEGAEMSEIASAYREESRNERLHAFEAEMAVKIETSLFSLLEKRRFSSEIEVAIASVAGVVMNLGIPESREQLKHAEGKGLVVRKIKSQEEETVGDLSRFIDLPEAKKRARSELLVRLEKERLGRRELSKLSAIMDLLVTPTLTFNKNETETRRTEAVEASSPVFFQVKEGEMIVREGERVTEEHVAKLENLLESSLSQANYVNVAGLFFMIAGMIYALYYFSIKNVRRVVLDVKDLLFLSLLLIGTLSIFSFTLPAYEALSGVFPHVPPTAYQYLFTAAAGAMLTMVVLNAETALAFSIAISILAALTMKNNLVFGIYTFVGCLVGAQSVRYCKYRVTLIKAGFYVGCANVAMALFIGLFSGDFFNVGSPFNLLFALIGGIITGVVVTGLTPAAEWLFNYTTNFKLLELASLDHPLLKELITQSPGTYHHSWIIGNLVETAAESINANPLLARVSALYHDIGKMKKPSYFFENLKNEKNPHDKLAPSLSSLILIGHVKDGIELAREYKLGKKITDIIPQHHGTRLITFFYQKAKDQEDPDVHEVNEKDFRYPGPKPQTKEAGLVMLADAVEAASRSIPDPTPARIQAVVKRLIGEIFADGQLDECELTLKDLNRIANSFNRILNGIYHARIEYPDSDGGPEKEGKSNGSTPRGTKEAEGRKKARGQKESQANSQPLTLQRIGA